VVLFNAALMGFISAGLAATGLAATGFLAGAFAETGFLAGALALAAGAFLVAMVTPDK
jgi:hypothetical protein